MFKVQITYPETYTQEPILTDTAISMNTPAVDEKDSLLFTTMKNYVDKANKLSTAMAAIEDLTKEYTLDKVTKIFSCIEDADLIDDIFSYIYNRINSQHESEIYQTTTLVKALVISQTDIVTDTNKNDDEPTEDTEEEKKEDVVEIIGGESPKLDSKEEVKEEKKKK